MKINYILILNSNNNAILKTSKKQGVAGKKDSYLMPM
jgi:hypothetical protein